MTNPPSPSKGRGHRKVTRGIRVRKRRAGWQLDFNYAGKRQQKQFPTKEAAEAAGRAMMEEAKREGVAALSLTASQRQDAARALAKLPKGVTLLAAAEAWVASRPAPASLSVPEAADLWLKAKEKKGLRPKTLDGYGFFAKALSEAFPIPVADLTSAMLAEWFDLRGWSGVTWNSSKALASAFLGWCVKTKHCSVNEAKDLERSEVDDGDIQYLDVEASRRLLKAAVATEPSLVPYIAVCLFAGVRPAEARRLDWKAIEEEHIRISSRVAKKRSRRLIDIRPNLRRWLEAFPGEGLLHWSRRGMRRVVAAAGIRWTQDVLRHTYASMLLADTGDLEKTALQLGHADTQVLHDHYKALVTPKEARKFWAIVPAEKVPATRSASKGT